MSGQTLGERIAQAHLAEGPDRPLRAGDTVSLRPRHVLTHDNTAAVLSKFRGLGVKKIHAPGQPVFALDHDIQNRSLENLAKYADIEAFAREQGVVFHAAGQGIGHQLMVSRGFVQPGSLCVGSDSHSNMYGALGALGTPVVRTDAAAIWATGEFWWTIPRTVKVILEGELPEGVTGKDLILTLCALDSRAEVLNALVEFDGPGVASLDMEARMSVANMSTEWGALAGMFPVDSVTVDYMRGVRQRLEELGLQRVREADLERWERDPLRADDDAYYSATLTVDLSRLSPQITGPHNVLRARALSEVQEERQTIDKAYLVSCVNSRLGDLRAAAAAMHGQPVASGVEFYVAAASADIQAEAEREGIWQQFERAGARLLPPGCGPCIGLGTGLLEPGEVAISATNRNFRGRMGSRDAEAYLASPAVVAASACAGYITGPDEVPAAADAVAARIDVAPPRPLAAETTEILDGFPAEIEGRGLWLDADNLDTDGIYGKDFTYRQLTGEEMAEVVLRNYDPDFGSLAHEDDVLVSGVNFGTGSSREQAATALMARGIRLVIAASYSQTYLRNAFNNGFPCIACPDFVAWLRQQHEKVAPTTVLNDPIVVDFAASVVRHAGREFAFAPLGAVPQSLVVAGGIENKIRRELGLDDESTER
jgi:homoaconitate hydratase